MAFIGGGVAIRRPAVGHSRSSACARRTVMKAQGELATKLGHALAAQWSNEAQAFENPPFFAHVRVFIRPLPAGLVDGIGFLYKSYYHIDLDNPYLCTVVVLSEKGDGVVVNQPHRITDTSAVIGGTRKVERIQNLTPDMIVPLPEGCAITFTPQGEDRWRGAICPGKKCLSSFKGNKSYIDGQYLVTPNKFISWDTGRDFETEEILWGSLAGPFDFAKVESYHLSVAEYGTKSADSAVAVSSN